MSQPLLKGCISHGTAGMGDVTVTFRIANLKQNHRDEGKSPSLSLSSNSLCRRKGGRGKDGRWRGRQWELGLDLRSSFLLGLTRGPKASMALTKVTKSTSSFICDRSEFDFACPAEDGNGSAA